MADSYTPVRLGQINSTGGSYANNNALFLKVFSGEVLMSFEQTKVTRGLFMKRTITSGKSAQFPVLGRSAVEYHTPGAELVGSAFNLNEKTIVINDRIVAHHFVDDLDEAKAHFDVRQGISTEMGRALAHQDDQYVLQTVLQAALTTTANVGDSGYPSGTIINDADADTNADSLISSLFDMSAQFDENYVDGNNRYCFLTPTVYNRLANGSAAIYREYGGTGSIETGRVPEVAGFMLIKTPDLPTTNRSAASAAPPVTGDAEERQAVDARNVVALCAHSSAVGELELMGLRTEQDRQVNRLGDLVVSHMAKGYGPLRPESAGVIRTAAPS